MSSSKDSKRDKDQPSSFYNMLRRQLVDVDKLVLSREQGISAEELRRIPPSHNYLRSLAAISSAERALAAKANEENQPGSTRK